MANFATSIFNQSREFIFANPSNIFASTGAVHDPWDQGVRESLPPRAAGDVVQGPLPRGGEDPRPAAGWVLSVAESRIVINKELNFNKSADKSAR